jgi:hypothetical protein
MYKKLSILIIFLLVIPISLADDDDSFDFWDFGDWLVDSIFDRVLDILNAAIGPLSSFTVSLIQEPVNIELFFGLWAIMVYILSLFYGLLLMFAGFKFVISGYDAEKRFEAKEWLKKVVLMVVFVQASYYIYQISLDLFAGMAVGILEMVNPDFFVLTSHDWGSFGLTLIYSMVYLIILIVYALFMGARYLLVNVGVIMFPIGIFLYFFQPAQRLGEVILSVLFMMMSVPFFHAVIFLTGSRLVDIPVFATNPIWVTIISYVLAIIVLIILTTFSIRGTKVIKRVRKHYGV